jgi:DNA repair protein RecO (recombination protein O)
MPHVNSDAVCVRHWDFSETSQTVSLLTRDLGMLRGLAKGAKRERGQFGGGIDLLTRGQIGALIKPGRELATLTHWDLLETFRHLRERLEANRAAFYMAELVILLIADAHPHPRSYDAFVRGLRGLTEPARLERELLEFQWVLLDDCGYRPELTPQGQECGEEGGDAETLAFSPRAGGVVLAGADDSGWPVRRETIEELRRLALEIDNRERPSASGTSPPSEGEDGSPGVPAAEDAAALALTAADSTRRASRLLAAYLREVVGTEPVTMSKVFGPIEVPRRSR